MIQITNKAVLLNPTVIVHLHLQKKLLMQKKGNKNSFMTLISLFSINLMYKYLFYSHSHNSNLIQTILISHFWLLYIFVIVTAQEDYEDDILEVDDGFTLSCEAASQFLFWVYM